MFVSGIKNALSVVWLLMDKILGPITSSVADFWLRATIRAMVFRAAGPVIGRLKTTSSSGNRGLRIYVRAHSSRTKLNGLNTKKERGELLNQIRINTWREKFSSYKKTRIKDAISRHGL